MTSDDIQHKLHKYASYSNIYVPEFTWGSLRIDALLIDVQHRWIRGFEIKVRKSDYVKDNKWTEYSKFCSSLCIVCPEGLIQPEEVGEPFGLMWVMERNNTWDPIIWKKRPKNFQNRNSLAWVWTYVKVIESELRRLDFDNLNLRENWRREDKPCYYCGEKTNRLAGNPDLWPLYFCHSDEPGKAKSHHVKCVTERLRKLEAYESQK